MTIQTIKRMLDACYQAKRSREMLPALPSGVTPSYIHFLDVIQIMERQGAAVKISDISEMCIRDSHRRGTGCCGTLL